MPRDYEIPYSNYPPGVSDADFNDKGMRHYKRKPSKPPTATMVYCPPCMRHWKAPAKKEWWRARVELCPKHKAEAKAAKAKS